ncbi:unnamed protein product, partial [Sphacelaria rigidula]
MLVLLLNLLIAVLSTRHAEVYANAEKEFHLARAKLIQYSWKAVSYGRQPPPFNLVTPVLGFTVDALGGVLSALVKLCMRSACAPEQLRGFDLSVPISNTYAWDSVMGAIHMLIFSATMGS